ncbi:MAG: cytidylate kinase-like family protein [Lachnospiraceae bacterium]|nr:cytidylate kinase-like family protein [Lachnospiraceae bacterium]
MKKQLIISVGREFGSGGHVIAEGLAKEFDIPLYDNNLLEHIAKEKHVDHEALKKLDEKPRNVLFSRTLKGHSTSPQDHVANLQFELLLEMARKGESFVIVGRCGEAILKEYEALVSIFVLGDREQKMERVQRIYQLSEEEARHKMEKMDLARKHYHNYYCEGKWGDSRNYDISINSSKLGIEGTTQMLAEYIKARRK